MTKQNDVSSQSISTHWGESFIKFPRRILAGLYSPVAYRREIAWLQVSLITLCYHTDGYRQVQKKMISCRRGEYVGTQMELAGIIGVSLRKLERCLYQLREEGFIEISRIPNGSRIRVCGYDAYTRPGLWEPKKASSTPPSALSSLTLAQEEAGLAGDSPYGRAIRARLEQAKQEQDKQDR